MYVSLPTDSAQMHNESYQHILIPFRKMLMCIMLLLCYGKEFLLFVCKGTQILLIILYKQTFFFAAEEVFISNMFKHLFAKYPDVLVSSRPINP